MRRQKAVCLVSPIQYGVMDGKFYVLSGYQKNLTCLGKNLSNLSVWLSGKIFPPSILNSDCSNSDGSNMVPISIWNHQSQTFDLCNNVQVSKAWFFFDNIVPYHQTIPVEITAISSRYQPLDFLWNLNISQIKKLKDRSQDVVSSLFISIEKYWSNFTLFLIWTTE